MVTIGLIKMSFQKYQKKAMRLLFGFLSAFIIILVLPSLVKAISNLFGGIT